MARIPSGSASARDRLVGAERILLARAGGENELLAPAHAPESLDDLAVLARFVFEAATQLGVPAVDVAWLLERLFTLLPAATSGGSSSGTGRAGGTTCRPTGARRRSGATSRTG